MLEDGPRGGPLPHLNVLEISDIDPQRSTSDLLPYLPCFRIMFTRLPDKPARVRHGITQVLLDDVQCVTQTLVKVRGPQWYIKVRKGNTYTFSSTGRFAVVTKLTTSSKAVCRRRFCQHLFVVDITGVGRASLGQSA